MGVGVLGGAFDPPHEGHLALARGGIEHFDLDRLLVRLVERPGHKEVDTPAAIRLALARLAFAGVVEAEVELDPFPRTVDSLAALELEDPVFLVGADEFADFLGWKEPDRVLELARLGVGGRPGVSRAPSDAVLSRLARPERVELFEIEPHDVASSEIREHVARGEALEGLVPPGVAARIRELGLYRDA